MTLRINAAEILDRAAKEKATLHYFLTAIDSPCAQRGAQFGSIFSSMKDNPFVQLCRGVCLKNQSGENARLDWPLCLGG